MHQPVHPRVTDCLERVFATALFYIIFVGPIAMVVLAMVASVIVVAQSSTFFLSFARN